MSNKYNYIRKCIAEYNDDMHLQTDLVAIHEQDIEGDKGYFLGIARLGGPKECLHDSQIEMKEVSLREESGGVGIDVRDADRPEVCDRNPINMDGNETSKYLYLTPSNYTEMRLLRIWRSG